jgi:16S rRNA (guanine966-N2)-methyltransferase
VRIITGLAKGRRLRAPATHSTRPATDRVREAVFSALGELVVGADVLDLYAGSGSYGLEALSRGAASATFVENGRLALGALSANVEGLGLGGTVIAATVEDFLSAPGTRTYHLVFIDPPWDLPTEAVERRLEALDPLVEGEGEVVVSRRRQDRPPQPPSGWVLAADRAYGDTRIYRYTKASEGDER